MKTSDATSQASEQAKFAAREFVARYERDMDGELPMPMILHDRLLFAFEMGYLRGRSDGALATVQLFDDLSTKESDK